MKVALYARVSTDEQAQHGTSLQTQVQNLKEFASRNGHKVHDIYIDDGYSGASLDRPALIKLRNDAHAGKFEGVFVAKTDRLSRSIHQVVNLVLEEFDKLNISFKSISEPYDTSTPSGKMFFVQLASFADFERETIRERMILGRKRRVEQGKCLFNVLPFGYGKTKDLDWTVNQSEEETYKQMVKWYMEDNLSFTQIAKKLTLLKVPTKWKKHGIWTHTVIRAILTKPLYKGLGIFNGIQYAVPRIISDQDWNRLQTRIDQRRVYRNPRKKHFYLLQGLLTCKKCECHFYCVAESAKNAGNYYCLSRLKKHTRPFCETKHIRQKLANAVIWERVSSVIKDSNLLLKAISSKKALGLTSEVTAEAELSITEKAIKAKNQEIEQLLSLYGKMKNLTADELDSRIGKIKIELKELHKQQDHLLTKIRISDKIRTDVKNIEPYLETLRAGLDMLDDAGKRELLFKVVDKIYVTWNEERKRHGFQIVMKFQISQGLPNTKPMTTTSNRLRGLTSEVIDIEI